MRVLIVGGGGRESALAWKLAKSRQVSKIYCAPGNAGTEDVAENIGFAAEDAAGLCAFAKDKEIDLTVVGPEGPLAAGIVDLFTEEGLTIFGPTQAAARLETSKAYMKSILDKADVPTARYAVFTDKDEAMKGLHNFDDRVVIKADGLAAGKGVVVASSRREAWEAVENMMVYKNFGDSGATIVMEEALDGEEASVLAFSDGERVLMMPPLQDHKPVNDGDQGPNTGGMGAYSPAPVVTDEMADWIEKEVMQKVVDTMRAEGTPYKGILYAGLMITDDGPKVLEFNCRFGDPECQPIMARLTSDLAPVLEAAANGDLSKVKMEWSDDAAICVVMAAGGYPGKFTNGKVITGIAEAESLEGVKVFQAGTWRIVDGLITAGGRVLGVTATGATIGQAIERAYEGVGKISWEGVHYRTDIGKKALDRAD